MLNNTIFARHNLQNKYIQIFAIFTILVILPGCKDAPDQSVEVVPGPKLSELESTIDKLKLANAKLMSQQQIDFETISKLEEKRKAKRTEQRLQMQNLIPQYVKIIETLQYEISALKVENTLLKEKGLSEPTNSTPKVGQPTGETEKLVAEIEQLKLQLDTLTKENNAYRIQQLSKSSLDSTKSSRALPTEQMLGNQQNSDAEYLDNKNDDSKADDSVRQFVETWQAAWMNKDLEEYQKHYIDQFTPTSGLSHDEWIENRRANFSKSGNIDIDITDLDIVTNNSNLNNVTVNFKQGFQSDTYSDSVLKTLTLVSAGESWKISKEVSTQ